MMDDTEKKVLSAFVAALNLSSDFEKDDLVYNKYPSWDSVAHMALVAALEDQFDCMLEMDDILDLSNFDKAVEIMKKYV